MELFKKVSAKVDIQRVSPRKARLVADLIRYKSTTEALLILRSTYKKTSQILLKLLNSVIANATNNAGLDATKLYISKLLVNDGPTLKRFQPHSQGRAFPILKRTSNFYIEVAELPSNKEINEKTVKMVEEENKTKASKSESKSPKAEVKSVEPKKEVTKKMVESKKTEPKKMGEPKKVASQTSKKPVAKKATETPKAKQETSKSKGDK